MRAHQPLLITSHATDEHIADEHLQVSSLFRWIIAAELPGPPCASFVLVLPCSAPNSRWQMTETLCFILLCDVCRALASYLRRPAALRTPGLFVNRADHMVPGTDSKIVRCSATSVLSPLFRIGACQPAALFLFAQNCQIPPPNALLPRSLLLCL